MEKNIFNYFDQLTKQEKEELIKTIYPTACKNGATTITCSSNVTPKQIIVTNKTNRNTVLDLETERSVRSLVTLEIKNDYSIVGLDYRVCNRTEVMPQPAIQIAYLKFMITKFGKEFADAYVKEFTKKIKEKTTLAIDAIAELNSTLMHAPINNFDDHNQTRVELKAFQLSAIEELNNMVNEILKEVQAEKATGVGV